MNFIGKCGRLQIACIWILREIQIIFAKQGGRGEFKSVYPCRHPFQNLSSSYVLSKIVCIKFKWEYVTRTFVSWWNAEGTSYIHGVSNGSDENVDLIEKKWEKAAENFLINSFVHVVFLFVSCVLLLVLSCLVCVVILCVFVVLCGHCCFLLQMPDCWLEVRIRKVLRPATSTQVFLGFPVPKSKCWDGSQDPKLPLHASNVALPT